MMARETEIQKLVDDTISCVDNISRVNCPDALAEKIRKMQVGKISSIWDRAVYMFSRPLVAAACVALVIVADVLVLKNRDVVNGVATQTETPLSTGFATASAALIDSENIQP